MPTLVPHAWSQANATSYSAPTLASHDASASSPQAYLRRIPDLPPSYGLSCRRVSRGGDGDTKRGSVTLVFSLATSQNWTWNPYPSPVVCSGTIWRWLQRVTMPSAPLGVLISKELRGSACVSDLAAIACRAAPRWQEPVESARDHLNER